MLKPTPHKSSKSTTPGALLGVLAFALVILVAATPITNLKFQGDANANGYSLTNVDNIIATNSISAPSVTSTNFIGSASSLTNFPGYSAMGLGSAAAKSAGAFLQTTNNLGEITGSNQFTARSNLNIHIYTPEDYGGKADGKYDDFATIVSGTNTVHDSSANFSSADVGKAILIYQGIAYDKTCSTTASNSTVSTSSTSGLYNGMYVSGGRGCIPLGTTISSMSGTNITLSTNALLTSTNQIIDFDPQAVTATIASVTDSSDVVISTSNTQSSSGNARIAWGTDNTTAIQNAVNAMAAAGTGTLQFQAGIYCMAGPLQDTTNRNSVILIPDNSTLQYYIMRGMGPSEFASNGNLAVQDQNITGTRLFCFTPGSGTAPSIFSGNSNLTTGGNVTGVTLDIRDMGFVLPMQPTMGAINEYNGGALLLNSVSVSDDYPKSQGGQLPAVNVTGIYFPNYNNGGDIYASRLLVSGMGTGVNLSLDDIISRSQFINCNLGIYVNTNNYICLDNITFTANVVDLSATGCQLFAHSITDIIASSNLNYNAYFGGCTGCYEVESGSTLTFDGDYVTSGLHLQVSNADSYPSRDTYGTEQLAFQKWYSNGNGSNGGPDNILCEYESSNDFSRAPFIWFYNDSASANDHSWMFTGVGTGGDFALVAGTDSGGDNNYYTSTNTPMYFSRSGSSPYQASAVHFNEPVIDLAENISSTQTTVSGSTAGTAICSMPFQGASYKKAIIFLNGFNGTGTYAFPTAFSSTNTLILGGTLSSDATVTTTSAAISTSTNSTGSITVEGY